MMEKYEMEKILNRSIRRDTYVIVDKMLDGDTYEKIIKDVKANRGIYGIRDTCSLVKKATCENCLKEIKSNYQYNNFLKLKDKKNQNINENYHKSGIYGIYVNEELVYIGMTTTEFGQRFASHKTKMNNKDGKMYIYLAERKVLGDTISLKPLFIRENAMTKEEITDRDLMAMELCLIEMYQPQFNIEGRFVHYEFAKARKPR